MLVKLQGPGPSILFRRPPSPIEQGCPTLTSNPRESGARPIRRLLLTGVIQSGRGLLKPTAHPHHPSHPSDRVPRPSSALVAASASCCAPTTAPPARESETPFGSKAYVRAISNGGSITPRLRDLDVESPPTSACRQRAAVSIHPCEFAALQHVQRPHGTQAAPSDVTDGRLLLCAAGLSATAARDPEKCAWRRPPPPSLRSPVSVLTCVFLCLSRLCLC